LLLFFYFFLFLIYTLKIENVQHPTTLKNEKEKKDKIPLDFPEEKSQIRGGVIELYKLQ